MIEAAVENDSDGLGSNNEEKRQHNGYTNPGWEVQMDAKREMEQGRALGLRAVSCPRPENAGTPWSAVG